LPDDAPIAARLRSLALMSEAGKAVFLSYASEDAQAALSLCAALRAVGIEVWFDRSELRGGDAWDATIRRQIKSCALFIPIISRNSHLRAEGYFRLEWKLAVDRSHLMAADKPFLLPVVIDDTDEADARIPERFREVQWTRLPERDTPPSFVAQVRRLLSSAETPGVARETARTMSTEFAASTAAQASHPATARAPRGPKAVLLGVAVLAIGAVAFVAFDRFWPAQRVPAVGPPAPATVADKSIAVLPFDDMSENKDQEYFSHGLAEELIDLLSKTHGLRVSARTSSFSFQGKATTVGEIGKVLNVGHVLEGSVRKAGNRARITVQLVRADDGFHQWSQTYDRDLKDIFAVQDDIARTVVDQLRVTLLGAAPATHAPITNAEAHNDYLQARYLMDREGREDLDKAVTLYQKAIERDPNYAPAWAWLAYCHTRRVAGGVDTTGAGYAKATAAAERAIALDPRLPEGFLSLGIARMQYDLNWAAAGDAIAKAKALEPNNPYVLQADGHLTQAIGRMSDAIASFRRSVDGDPLNLLVRRYLGRALHYAGRLDEAETLLRQSIELKPEFPVLHYELGRTLLRRGQNEAAFKAFAAEPDPEWKRFGLPLGYQALNRSKDAQAALAALVANSAGSEFQVAETYAYLGQADKAFEWLDKAVKLHDPGVIWVRRDALMRSIVADPRYGAFLKRMKFPPEPTTDD
jgi:TolB-like protein/Tfp pilus assembly protein PilF